MHATLFTLAFLATLLPVNGLNVDFFNGPSCSEGILNQVNQDNTNGDAIAVSAPLHLSYPSVFLTDLPSAPCWAYDGEGCSGNGGAVYLDAGRVNGCFDAASGMEAIRSVCCTMGQGDGETNHVLYQVPSSVGDFPDTPAVASSAPATTSTAPVV
ncbi:hypothetical protein G7Z17_g4055 [Cylindrodendrum hubeiense]|uniref:Uncharacterized protein n=1 Tax=Cylindrodendrum hubeiense TaxID=595255 RepID=A0A9P5HHN7_9HYPO|nr:hypothetical protein G7Z17_g4055 [Cylindrodendrum hubeiense]